MSFAKWRSVTEPVVIVFIVFGNERLSQHAKSIKYVRINGYLYSEITFSLSVNNEHA